MKPFKSLIPLEEAEKTILEITKPIKRTEEAPIEDALNRILSEDLVANMDIPPFDRASMDGYAVIASDTFEASRTKHIKLKVIGSVHAGETCKLQITKGDCTQIATGAMMPQGANAVVMIEETDSDDTTVQIFKPVHPNENVSKKGEDIRTGTKVLKKGTQLSPRHIGVGAALGISKLRVFEKPKVAIIPTGNEICDIRGKLAEGQVYDINSHTLMAIVLENGGIPVKLDIIPDDRKKIETAIKKTLRYDLIVLSGGSSVGERDYLVDVITKLGEVKFHGVQIKPGKPTICGAINGKVILGMPGYPTACLTNGYVFLAPLIRAMARLPEKSEKTVKCIMSQRTTSTLGRHQFLTVRLVDGKAVPVFKESGAITSMADADGYVEIPANVDMIEKDEEVEVKLF